MPFAAEAPVNKSVHIAHSKFNNTTYTNQIPISPLAGAGATTLKHNSVHLPNPIAQPSPSNSQNFYNVDSRSLNYSQGVEVPGRMPSKNEQKPPPQQDFLPYKMKLRAGRFVQGQNAYDPLLDLQNWSTESKLLTPDGKSARGLTTSAMNSLRTAMTF